MHEYIGNEGESAMCVYACRFGWDKLVTLLFAKKNTMRELLCFFAQYSLDDLRQHVLFFLWESIFRSIEEKCAAQDGSQIR